MAGHYLRNAWYPAAWAYEVAEGVLARKILDEPVVLFRTPQGAAGALEDRCPHRFAPLSRGQVTSAGIRCGYHGLEFGPDGACTHSPFTKTPPRAGVRNYPLVEKDGLLWIWPGEPHKADATAVADFGFMSDEARYRTVRGVSHVRADYQLCVDNLMDLSHIEYVHGGTFGAQGVIHKGSHRAWHEEGTIHSNWWMPDIPNPPSQERNFPTEGRHVDHWIDMRWNAPASMLLDVGVTPTGQPREAGAHILGAHLLTPETDGACHYFWSMGRTYARDSVEVDSQARAYLVKACDEEDTPMIEAVARSMNEAEFWSLGPLLLPIDAGAVRVRRALQQMIDGEEAGASQ
jgi:phenylpropionate dioxygenase-like ring-hydroxylating dioxygenase large terminal subunit